ncbi:hypothetical protein ACF0H5_008742 [Mactra antiquata]
METCLNYNELVMSQLVRLDENLEFVKDLEISSFAVNKDFEIKSEFDVMLNEFTLSLSKTSQNKPTEPKTITLDEYELSALNKKNPLALAIARRYTYKTSAKTLDYPIDLVENEEFQFRAVLFVKENLYRKGQLSLDIRKCSKNESSESKYIYTKIGVRLTIDEGKELLQKLGEVVKQINLNTKLTRDLLLSAEVCIIIKTIKELNSQREGGHVREWKDMVKDEWDCAVLLTNPADVWKIAESAAEKLPNIKGLVTSMVNPIETPTMDEKREKVLDSNWLANDELYATCKLVSDTTE